SDDIGYGRSNPAIAGGIRDGCLCKRGYVARGRPYGRTDFPLRATFHRLYGLKPARLFEHSECGIWFPWPDVRFEDPAIFAGVHRIRWNASEFNIQRERHSIP